MKSCIAISACLAWTNLFASIAVTPSQMTNYVERSVSSLSNYVESTIGGVSTNAGPVAENALAMAKAAIVIATNSVDNSATVNDDGSWSVSYYITSSNGIPNLKTVTYDVDVVTNVNTYQGFEVTASSLDGVPTGTKYCCTDGPTFYCDYVKSGMYTALGRMDFNAVKVVVGSRIDYLENTYGDWSGTEVQICAYSWPSSVSVISNDIAHLKGMFTIRPCYMSYVDMTNCLGTSSYSYSDIGGSWLSKAVESSTGLTVYLTQRTALSSVARSSLSAKYEAGKDFPWPATKPSCGMVYWADYKGDCASDEYYEPEYWYSQKDWNNTANWPDWPSSVTFDAFDEDSGLTVQVVLYAEDKGKKKGLNSIYKKPYFNWYELPVKKKVKNCSDSGHVWKQDTSTKYTCRVCDRCPKSEGHNLENLPTSEDCAICDNEYYTFTKDAHGNYTITGTYKCERYTHATGEDYHGGWHHEGDEAKLPNTTVYYCACKCGDYGVNGITLSHDIDDEGEVTSWEDCGDGAYHRGLVTCKRGTCGHKSYYYEKHTLNTKKTTLKTPVESYEDGHVVVGPCTKGCGANDVEGIEAHTPDPDKNCTCSVCDPNGEGDSYHDMKDAECGTYVLGQVCRNCGYTDEDASTWWDYSSKHQWADPIEYEDGTYDMENHQCKCGEMTQEHDNTFKEGGVCVCGLQGKSTSGGGRKCPFKYKSSNESGSSSRSASLDRDHTGKECSATLLGGTCSQCGGSFTNDFPYAIFSLPAAYGIYGHSSLHGFVAYCAGVSNLTAAIAVADEKRSVWANGYSVGDTIQEDIMYNIKNNVEYNAFLQKTVTNQTYNMSRYSGTVQKYDDGSLYIQW